MRDLSCFMGDLQQQFTGFAQAKSAIE